MAKVRSHACPAVGPASGSVMRNGNSAWSRAAPRPIATNTTRTDANPRSMASPPISARKDSHPGANVKGQLRRGAFQEADQRGVELFRQSDVVGAAFEAEELLRLVRGREQC